MTDTLLKMINFEDLLQIGVSFHFFLLLIKKKCAVNYQNTDVIQKYRRVPQDKHLYSYMNLR